MFANFSSTYLLEEVETYDLDCKTWKFYELDDNILRVDSKENQYTTKCEIVQDKNYNLTNFWQEKKIYIPNEEGYVWLGIVAYDEKPDILSRITRGLNVVSSGTYGQVVENDGTYTKYEIMDLEKAVADSKIYNELLQEKPFDCLPYITDMVKCITPEYSNVLYPTYVVRYLNMPKASPFTMYNFKAVDLVNRIWSVAEKYLLMDMKPANTVIYEGHFRFIDFDDRFILPSNAQYLNFTFMSYVFITLLYRTYDTLPKFFTDLWNLTGKKLKNYTNCRAEAQEASKKLDEDTLDDLNLIIKLYGSKKKDSVQNILDTLPEFVEALKGHYSVLTSFVNKFQALRF